MHLDKTHVQATYTLERVVTFKDINGIQLLSLFKFKLFSAVIKHFAAAIAAGQFNAISGKMRVSPPPPPLLMKYIHQSSYLGCNNIYY